MGPYAHLRKSLGYSTNNSNNISDALQLPANCKRRVNLKFASSIIQETLTKNLSLRKGKVKDRKTAGVNVGAIVISQSKEALKSESCNITSSMSFQPEISPNCNRGKGWRGKKKRGFKPGLPDLPYFPLVSQGIPHLANSFIQLDDKELHTVTKETDTIESVANEKSVEFNNSSVTVLGVNPEMGSSSLSQSDSDLSQSTLNTMSLNYNLNNCATMTASENQGQDSTAQMESKRQNEIAKSGEKNFLLQPSEIQHTLPVAGYNQMQKMGNRNESKSLPSENCVNFKELPKNELNVEFVSEYSNTNVKKKIQDNEIELKSDPQSISITPLQPVFKLVDPAQLEKETEQYYKEMGSLSGRPLTKAQASGKKNECLISAQVATITNDYPQINSSKEKSADLDKRKAAWALLHQYWTHCQENPYDFDGWTNLLNHVETIDDIGTARSAFEGFLPLYPYCFAYWIKFSDLELKFTDLEKALGVMYLGTKCVPFCSELWVPFLKKFLDYASKENVSEEIIRGSYEYALSSVGLSWNSSSLWEFCVNYELTKGDLLRVINLYRRLLSIPTKLYNKHWDHLLALIRDYHPRNLLTIEEYSALKKGACDLLKIKFNPPTLEEPTSLLKVTQPEDKIHTTIKEKIVAFLIPVHEANEKECEKRWKFEDKIKRPYFHVKPLEKKQLKTWKEYLDFEIKEGDPIRIVTLFERCLVPCAMYEELWCKYASYVEDHVLNVLKKKYANVDYKPGCFLPGDKTDNDSSKVNLEKKLEETDDKTAESSESDNIISELWRDGAKKLEVNPETKFEVTFLLNRLSEGIGVGGRVLAPPLLTPTSILRDLTWEDVRQIYRRGAWIHCPSKPLILMQWAEFEEAQENIQTARELLNTVIVKHPKLLRARIQLIELERRSNDLDRVEELYAQTFAIFNEKRVRSFLAIRYARFLFKIREEDDKALLILRKALKKDKGNIHLYHHVFDVCYQRRPIDCNGVLASVLLALASKELSLEDKYWFCLKRSEFLKEHGTMTQVKEAKAEMEEIKLKLDKEKLIITIDDDEPRNDNAEDKDVIEVNNNDRKSQKLFSEDQMNGSGIDEFKNIDGQLVLLQPPQPPVLDPVHVSKKDRERRKRREERDGSIEGRRHKKKSSRSSKKDKKSSKKSKRHRRRDTEEEEDGEVPEEGELEEGYDADGVLYGSKEEANLNVNNFSRYGSNMQPVQLQQQQQLQERGPGVENKPYQAVPPSWNLNASSMSNFGYGGASEVVKDGQNSLYERYYDMIKQGYGTNQEKTGNPQQNQLTVHGSQIILGNKNCYLPPPPMPQGILGESLFNQGKLENLHNLSGKQGNLLSAGSSPIFPPLTSCLPPSFSSRTMQSHDGKPNTNNKLIQGPPLPFLPTSSMGMPSTPLNPTTQINPDIIDNSVVNFNRNNLNEPPGKLARLDPSHGTMNHSQPAQRVPLLGDCPPGMKPADRENIVAMRNEREHRAGGRGDRENSGRGRSNRNARSRDRSRHQHHQDLEEEHSHSTGASSQHQPVPPPPQPQFNPLQHNPFEPNKPQLISLNIKEILQENLASSICNVPEWLIKEGGELRLSDTSNGESIIRYWPRYMNDDGHTTLFQSLRKSVKWHQRVMLVGPSSENNWVTVPKLMSWIGPCNYEKDGWTLEANTQWPPEIVDLLHRLIRFSNSQFNSCLMSLYQSGFSHHPWHTEAHEAMAKNPTTACISLGVTRILEMKRVNGVEYLRFPLFPGSLFIMEGACHTDWQCQIPKEPQMKGERVTLSFRTMLMIKGVTV